MRRQDGCGQTTRAARTAGGATTMSLHTGDGKSYRRPLSTCLKITAGGHLSSLHLLRFDWLDCLVGRHHLLLGASYLFTKTYTRHFRAGTASTKERPRLPGIETRHKTLTLVQRLPITTAAGAEAPTYLPTKSIRDRHPSSDRQHTCRASQSVYQPCLLQAS